MCEFLKGENHKDIIKIRQLEELLTAETEICDYLFEALSELPSDLQSEKMKNAIHVYSSLLISRETTSISSKGIRNG